MTPTPDPEDSEREAGCGHGQRHWFAPYGQVGVVRAKCVRCGAPNPKWPALVRRIQRGDWPTGLVHYEDR